MINNIIILDQASLIYDGGLKLSLKCWSDIWKYDLTMWAFAYNLPMDRLLLTVYHIRQRKRI